MSSPIYKDRVTIGETSVDIVVIEELQSHWVAQCLQLRDMNCGGRTPREALDGIIEKLEVQLLPFVLRELPQQHAAPLDYWQRHRLAIPFPAEEAS